MQFEYRYYDRPFRQPLRTHHRIWERREGVIVRLQVDPGIVGWGEIVPLPNFGTETLDEAIAFCAEFVDQFVVGDQARLQSCEVGPIARGRAGDVTPDGVGHLTSDGIDRSSHASANAFIACCLDRLQDIESLIQDCDQFPPATQFGMGAAISSVIAQLQSRLDHPSNHPSNHPTNHPSNHPAPADPPPDRLSTLLPAGTAALTALPDYLARGRHTFKLKIGIDDRPSEQALIRQLLAQLPPHGKLRLDANGAFDLPTTTAWLTWLDTYPGAIEYLEQPLNAHDRHTLPTLIALSRNARTPIALDESVATLPQLERAIALGWPGLWIIKPAIVGAPQALRSLWQRQVSQGARPDWIFSSVFESRVGRAIALDLAAELGSGDRALGFGVDALLTPEPEPWPHILWQSAPPLRSD
jgi:O-succinylbenzoate synthase